MLRTKITELGELRLLDDGGLVFSVFSDEPPSLDESILKASFRGASPDPSELAIGDKVTHCVHGVARYQGCRSISQDGRQIEFLVLEFADCKKLYVPQGQSYLIQKLGRATCQLSNLGRMSAKRPQLYCIEALPNAYQWQDIGIFPEFPEEPRRKQPWEPFYEAVAEWRRAYAAYQEALHASSSYRQAAQEYFERQSSEPLPLLGWWAYRAVILRVGPIELSNVRNRDEVVLLIKQYVLRRDRSIERIRREVEILENYGRFQSTAREPIPEEVRLFVWRRDKGHCVRCGSCERLEFDHIIPVTAGGSSTERNVQLLCESCNRSKGATV